MRCCVELRDVQRKITLLDTKKYNNRTIKIWQCPICHCLKAELQQYNLIIKRYEYEKPKRKHVAEWIRAYESEPYLENITNIKQGTRENMNWLFQCNGNIIDFNNTIRVKNYNNTPIEANFTDDRELIAV